MTTTGQIASTGTPAAEIEIDADIARGLLTAQHDREARQRAMTACHSVSAATWRRARSWAVLYGVMLLDTGLVDDPRMAAIAERTFDRLVEGP